MYKKKQLKELKQMKKIVEIRNLKIGEGIPKVCVPLVGRNDKVLLEEIENLEEKQFDVVEWRMDYHECVENLETMKNTVALIRKYLRDTPLLATFRTKKEGGERVVETNYYIELNKAVIETGEADLIDVELFTGEDAVKELIGCAHAKGLKVVVSNHDFKQTPSKEVIVERLRKMQELGADLPKIAVMPQSAEDVLVLLSATYEMSEKYAQGPIITMSMAGAGVVSRLAGEIFGSSLTFGAAKEASAPGQLPVAKLNEILKVIHESR